MKKSILLLIYIIFAVYIMTIIDGIVQPHYFIKSAIKILLFGAIPLIYLWVKNPAFLKVTFKINKKSLVPTLAIGIILYLFIVMGYIILANFIDFSNITTALEDAMQVNAANFIFVALYISFINSLLEEFFFRGFALEALKGFKKRAAIVISAFLFAIYHVAMKIGWYQIVFFLIAILALFFVGLMFIWLNQKFKTIYASWIVHLCCNLGINTVGLILFDIL